MGGACFSYSKPYLNKLGNLDSSPYDRSVETINKTPMANTISNMKMTNPIRELVSKSRKRFVQDGYNLDLTYIRDNLIAMGYPAEKLEGVYRNHIDDVVAFLEERHKDHYKIYNLCSERSYDISKFQGRVAYYKFDDHNPPKIELIRPFCNDVHKWLCEDKRNVAAVHCKAGKGRTGVMVCCYMLHTKLFTRAEDALNDYGQRRTTDTKGVTIPSQRRYVGYYADLVNEDLQYKETTLVVRELRLEPPPLLNGSQSCLQFMISNSNGKLYESQFYEIKKGASHMSVHLDKYLELTGDIKVEFFNKTKVKRREKIFHFWFNTFFVRDEIKTPCLNGNELPIQDRSTRALSCEEPPKNSQIRNTRANSLTSVESKMVVLQLRRNELDKQNKICASDFQVSLFFHKVPTACAASVQSGSQTHQFEETPSESSEGEEDGWESAYPPEGCVGSYQPLRDNDHRSVSYSDHLLPS